MELGHLLTRSGLTYPEVYARVCHDSFCQSGSSVSLPWVIYYLESWNIRGLGEKEEELDKILNKNNIKISVITESKKKL